MTIKPDQDQLTNRLIQPPMPKAHPGGLKPTLKCELDELTCSPRKNGQQFVQSYLRLNSFGMYTV